MQSNQQQSGDPLDAKVLENGMSVYTWTQTAIITKDKPELIGGLLERFDDLQSTDKEISGLEMRLEDMKAKRRLLMAEIDQARGPINQALSRYQEEQRATRKALSNLGGSGLGQKGGNLIPGSFPPAPADPFQN